MFGYVMANLGELEKPRRKRYTQVYCGICRAVREQCSQACRLGLSYDMADCWAKLDGVTGKNGGAVYVYCDETKNPVIVTNETQGLDKIFILKNNIIIYI